MKTTTRSSSKNRTEDAVHQVKGTIKEAAGNLGDNPELKTRGRVEKIAGKIQDKIGQAGKVSGK